MRRQAPYFSAPSHPRVPRSRALAAILSPTVSYIPLKTCTPTGSIRTVLGSAGLPCEDMISGTRKKVSDIGPVAATTGRSGSVLLPPIMGAVSRVGCRIVRLGTAGKG